jgi:hypothetical protein
MPVVGSLNRVRPPRGRPGTACRHALSADQGRTHVVGSLLRVRPPPGRPGTACRHAVRADQGRMHAVGSLFRVRLPLIDANGLDRRAPRTAHRAPRTARRQAAATPKPRRPAPAATARGLTPRGSADQGHVRGSRANARGFEIEPRAYALDRRKGGAARGVRPREPREPAVRGASPARAAHPRTWPRAARVTSSLPRRGWGLARPGPLWGARGRCGPRGPARRAPW